MPNVILLLAAGFSKNWNGPLANEVTQHLMSRLQDDASLRDLLHEKNFDDALFQLQMEFLLLDKRKINTVMEARLIAFQSALSDVFDRMNQQFQSRPFDFSNDVARKVERFLIGFDAIFTLNQDLLLELHYRNDDVALWHGTRWQGWEMPGMHPLPVTDHLNPASNRWRPAPPFQSNDRMQPYYSCTDHQVG